MRSPVLQTQGLQGKERVKRDSGTKERVNKQRRERVNGEETDKRE